MVITTRPNSTPNTILKESIEKRIKAFTKFARRGKMTNDFCQAKPKITTLFQLKCLQLFSVGLSSADRQI